MSPQLEHSGLSYPVRVLGLEQNFRFEVTCKPWPLQTCAEIRGATTERSVTWRRRDGDGARASEDKYGDIPLQLSCYPFNLKGHRFRGKCHQDLPNMFL